MITMNDDELDSPKAIKAFLGGTDKLKFSVPKSNCYAWVANTLKRTGYLNLSKKDKGPVREYMELMTGYSWSQLIGHDNAHQNVAVEVPVHAADIQKIILRYLT